MKLPAIPPKPPDNQVKVNFDGAFDPNTGSGGWGYIVATRRAVLLLLGRVNLYF
jgi:ribonuclease HI